MQKLFGSKGTSPGQWALSLPLTFSAEIPGRETPLGKCRNFSMYILNCDPIVDSSTVIAPDGMPPDHSSLTMDSSQYPDHHTPPELSGSPILDTQSELPYESVPLVRLIVVHRSAQSFSSARFGCDRLRWSVPW
jgi:hypothetical protein